MQYSYINTAAAAVAVASDEKNIAELTAHETN